MTALSIGKNTTAANRLLRPPGVLCRVWHSCYARGFARGRFRSPGLKKIP